MACTLLHGVAAKRDHALERRMAGIREQYLSRPELKVRHALPHELDHQPTDHRRAQEVSDEWSPFRMKYDFRLNRTEEENQYINKLMTSIAAVIGSMISAKTKEPPFLLESYIDLLAPAGVHDADMVMIVDAPPIGDGEDDCSEDTLAFATFIQTGEKVNRPIYGYMRLCLLFPDNPFFDVETGVHEVLHALGFIPDIFYEDEANRQFVDILEDGHMAIVSPRVKQFVRAHFGCESMEGATLEDDGGSGSALGHWENRLYDGEMMVYSGEPSFQHASRNVLSALTLAYMEDTGWYEVDYNYAGILSFGYKAGCPLAHGTYEEALQDPASAFYLCDTELDSAAMCLHDRTAVGQCTTQYDGFDSIDGFYRVRLAGYDADILGNQALFECAAHAPGLRCIDAVEPYFIGGDLNKFPTCVNMTCSAEGKVLIDGKPCEDTYGKNGAKCPDQEKFCGSPGWLTCVDTLNDCSERGDCHNGRCFCHTGKGGADCSEWVCVPGQACADGSTCPSSGFCGVTRQPTETFKGHLLRVYGVEADPIPDSYNGLAVLADLGVSGLTEDPTDVSTNLQASLQLAMAAVALFAFFV